MLNSAAIQPIFFLLQLLSVLCGNVARSFSQTSLDKIFHTTPQVRRRLGSLSVTNATQAEKTTAIPPHSVRQKISLQIDISVSKNALTSIFFLAMYQYIWFGDLYDTEAEKTLILHMPAPLFPIVLFICFSVCLLGHQHYICQAR